MIRFFSCKQCGKEFSIVEGTGEDQPRRCPFCSSTEPAVLRDSGKSWKSQRKAKEQIEQESRPYL